MLIGNPAFSGNKEQSFDVLLQRAKSFINKNTDSVNHFARKAYIIAEKNNKPEQELDAILVLIKSKIKSGKLIYALKLCDSAKLIAKKNKLIERETDVLVHLGKVYNNMGFATEALELFTNAKKDLQENNSLCNKAELYYDIAIVHFELGEIAKCNDYIQLSLNEALDKNYFEGAFPSYLFLANTAGTVDDSIQKYLLLANQLLVDHPALIYEKVVLRNNQAKVNEELGNIDLSRKQYHEAINLSITNNFQEYLSTIYNNYAYLLLLETKYDSTILILNKALKIARALNSIDLQASIFESFSDYNTVIKDYQKALIYKDSAITKRLQYREQQSLEKSLFLSTVIETQQNEKEILHQKNKIKLLWVVVLIVIVILLISLGLVILFRQKFNLSRVKLETVQKRKALEIADAMIQSQDAERKRLAMDLHDSLGAGLSALRFLVDGFFKSNEKYNDISNSIVNIQRDVRDLSHRMLPAQLADVGLVKVIENMISYINKSGKFTVEFETNLTKRIADNLEINLYYLFYELINNATTHSDGNNIFIQLVEHDNFLYLSVEDNGLEFDHDENSDGIGLKNINARVEYLGGKLTIESNKSETTFLIEIPIN